MDQIKKINISEKLSLFNDYWNPRIVGDLNGHHVKLVNFLGEFVWHKHDHEDELFYVVEGKFIMEFRDKKVELCKGDFLIVSKSIEHKPVAENEVSVMLFEPSSILNAGNTKGELTKEILDTI